MPTNVNFVGELKSEDTTQVSFNLPKTLSLGTVKKSFNNSGISEAEGCSYLTLNSLSQTALLGKASLVINPSSFSENAVYADVPANSTLGDLTFTRATDAWRTNSAGLVQRTPWNVFLSSQQFDSGNWGKGGATVTANTAIAPNGTLTADSFILNAAGSCFLAQTLTLNSTTCTISVYVKYIDRQFIQFVYGSTFSGNYANFDLINGTIIAGTYTAATISSVGNGWFRISMTVTGISSTAFDAYIWAVDLGTSARASNCSGTGSYYVWGAQIVEGSSALEYFPTTDRQDVPRIDYSLGGCPTLLMEPQRTNGVTESARMYNWGTFTALGATSPTNVIATGFQDPTGQSSACLVTGTNGTVGAFGIFQLLSTTYTTGTVLTVSVYAKRGTNDFLYLSQANISFTGTGFAYFNLATGTTPTAGAQIVNVGNGWYRCIMPPVTLTANTTASYNVGHYIAPSETNMIWSTNYLGKSMYFYGAQVEAGAYPTSYIPTTSATVTRNADAASKSGISSLFGQTEGTVAYKLYLNKTVGGGLQVFSTLTNDSNTLFYAAYLGNAGQITFDFYIGGVYTFSFSSGVVLSTGVNNIAVVYKAGAYKFFVNGVLTNTNTNATVITSTISRLNLASALDPFNGSYYSVIAFKTALSDAECIALTTP